MSSQTMYDGMIDEELYDDLKNEKLGGSPAKRRRRQRHDQNKHQVPNNNERDDVTLPFAPNNEGDDVMLPFAFFSNNGLLSDDLLGDIFEYLPQQFFFVAGTCKRFHCIYKKISTKQRDDDDKKKKKKMDKKIKDTKIKEESKVECLANKRSNDKKSIQMKTTIQSVIESVSRVNLYLEERAFVPEVTLLLRIADAAALYGNVAVLRFALSKLLNASSSNSLSRVVGCRICNNAAKNGHLNLLKAAREEFNCSWNATWIMIHAAENGHLEVLKWARQNGCSSSWGQYICLHAAAGGRLEVLIWLKSNGCPWSKDASSYAARNGHLDTLVWLNSNGCPWDEDTCAAAARNGHLHVLQWAYQNGCPWNAKTTSGARRFRHIHVLEWAKANGCPDDEEEGEEDYLLGQGFDEVLNGA